MAGWLKNGRFPVQICTGAKALETAKKVVPKTYLLYECTVSCRQMTNGYKIEQQACV
jgi:hypothetical protein